MDDFLAYPLEKPKKDSRLDIQALARFRRALRREDQEALDDLLVSVKGYWSLARTVPHLMPLEFALLAMLLEQHKGIRRLGRQADSLNGILGETASATGC